MVEVKRFSIGEVAARSGVATSALRFYEEHGLITSDRADSNHRRYHADVLRRVSFIRVAQKVGLTLAEIKSALELLPERRTPNRHDWADLAASWGPRLDEQIATLQRLRENLDGCIGCGCLSLETCAIWNPDDVAAELGTGPRYVLSDERPVMPPGSSAAERVRSFVERELDERLAASVDEPGESWPRRNRCATREDRTEQVAVELAAGSHHQSEPAAPTHRRPVAVRDAHRVGPTGGEHRGRARGPAEMVGQSTMRVIEALAVVDRDQHVLFGSERPDRRRRRTARRAVSCGSGRSP